ncbi:pectate lyase [Streptomyces sp. NPDC056227]|uniref:pectate lyase n=1 Tax=Streptomyces sp. NPDC056227 TaxID=3345753 RepID=UPI0035E380F0
MYGRHVRLQNIRVTSPGDTLVGINSNYGDAAQFSGLAIHDDAGTDIDICARV